jgi:hypothetical protein
MTARVLTIFSFLRSQRAVNLAKLADSIRADRDLCSIVTETACEEFGWPWLGVEDAVVLLGGKRLCALLLNSNRGGRGPTQVHRALHGSSIAPAANLRQLKTLQGELQ